MITLLENVLERSDGSYISSQDLQVLDQAIASWQKRRETYDLVQAREAEIIGKTLKKFQKGIPFLSKPLSEDVLQKCSRDISVVLRYSATAMLLQDEELLKDRLLYWMQNIMRALRHQKINDQVYQLLQKAVQEQMPPENSSLLMPYLKIAHEWLSQ
ncbi:MAG TPA: phycocyanin [Oculatellaceae cyanobacterium]|jgi:hypothetical protein